MRRGAFTLVELLVVIAIIGVLVGLLLPAISGAREAARAALCKNNCKELSLACLAHHTAREHLPAGGWGFRCLGVASRGFGPQQPGGWIYSVLPFIEQQALWSGSDISDAAHIQGMSTLIQTPLAMLICPSRRPLQTFTVCYPPWTPYMIPTPTQVARSDYAMNGNYKTGASADDNSGPADLVTQPAPFINDGMTGQAWWVPMASVTDGAANTYLLGEKWIPSDHYLDGFDYGDNENAYIGSDRDVLRNETPPAADAPSGNNVSPGSNYAFGGPHLAGFHMAFADGHVQQIQFSIDPAVHALLCNRHDGTAVRLEGL